jgi:hemolysin activation/secretion protein
MGRLLVAVLLTTALTSPAFSQTAAPAPFIIDRNRTDRAPAPPVKSAPPVAQPKADEKLASVKPFVLTGVRIEGTSLAPAILSDASRGFIGQTIDAKAIADIAQHVSDAYANAGDVALYTVTVPDQDFAGGVLRLVVTEGYIEHVDLHGDVSGDLSRVTALAQKLTTERPLKRSTLERYLSLIRDLPGLTVDAQLLQGDATSAVKLSLGLTQKRYQVGLSLNDAGNSLLGRVQLQADVSLYNLLREGEQTDAIFGTSTLFNRYQYYALSHSEALDDEGTRATAGYGYLKTRIPQFNLTGNAQTLQFAVSHPFIRGYNENLSVTASIDGIDSDNALLGISIANEDVRTARVAAGYTLVDSVSALTLSASISQGIDGLGARTDPAVSDAAFSKLVVQGGYNHLISDDWVVRLRGVTQLAGDKLPSSELYALGGGDFGRAFLADSVLGDSAVAESLEIGFDPKNVNVLTGWEIFGFADDGDVWARARAGGPSAHDSLASAGVGIRLPIGGQMKLDLEAADAIHADAPGLNAGGWRFLFGITANY